MTNKWICDNHATAPEHRLTIGRKQICTFKNSSGYEVHLLIDGVNKGHYRQGGLYQGAAHKGFDTLADAKSFGQSLL